MTTELATREPQTLAIANSSDPVAGMLEAVIKQGVTTQNVAALEQLVGLYERMQDRDAEKQFAIAFSALQADTPSIQAVKPVPSRDGTVKYRYAPYDVVMDEVRPLLVKHGFTVTFSTDYKDGRVIQECTLQHIGGHKRTNRSMARVGNGPPGSSEAQADGAASTYAKRKALCDCLNIIVETDTDARSEGAPITQDQADELRKRVRACGADEAAFLKFAGVGFFEDIGADRYAACSAAIAKKEAQKR